MYEYIVYITKNTHMNDIEIGHYFNQWSNNTFSRYFVSEHPWIFKPKIMYIIDIER